MVDDLADVREHQAARLKERVYITFTALAVVLALEFALGAAVVVLELLAH
jgi:hypothetical protein